MMTPRQRFLEELIGKPWKLGAKGPEAFDCYYLVEHVQRDLFGRTMPTVEYASDLSFKGIIREINKHVAAHADTWGYVEQRDANDGAIVIMGSAVHGSHLGVWFARERAVLHVDNPEGVTFENLLTLKLKGWTKQLFLRPLV